MNSLTVLAACASTAVAGSNFGLEIANGQQLVNGWHVSEIELFDAADCIGGTFDLSPVVETPVEEVTEDASGDNVIASFRRLSLPAVTQSTSFENHPQSLATDGVVQTEYWTKYNLIEKGQASIDIELGTHDVRSIRISAHSGFTTPVDVHLHTIGQAARGDGSHLVNRVACV